MHFTAECIRGRGSRFAERDRHEPRSIISLRKPQSAFQCSSFVQLDKEENTFLPGSDPPLPLSIVYPFSVPFLQSCLIGLIVGDPLYRAVSKNTLVAFVGGVYCALLKSGGLGRFMGMGIPFSFLRFLFFNFILFFFL